MVERLYRSVCRHPGHDDFTLSVFWQAAQEVEEERKIGRQTVEEREGQRTRSCASRGPM